MMYYFKFSFDDKQNVKDLGCWWDNDFKLWCINDKMTKENINALLKLTYMKYDNKMNINFVSKFDEDNKPIKYYSFERSSELAKKMILSKKVTYDIEFED
jgi:hypothetical protein